MRFLASLFMALLILPLLGSAAVIYNDPEVFWVRENAAYFTDPATNQQIPTYRLSNEQIRIYLKNNAVRIQLGLEPIERETVRRMVNPGPVTLQQYFATKELNQAYNALTGPGYTPLRKQGPKYIQPPLTFKPRVQPWYDETQWVYENTQRIHDNIMGRNYRSDYYGDENLKDMLDNNRVRYQPWGEPKYYD